LIHGSYIDFENVRVTLPGGWLAVRSDASLELLHLAGKRTTEIFLVPAINGAPEDWVGARSRWVASKRAKYEKDGYIVTTVPMISALGEPAACVAVARRDNQNLAIVECGLDKGRLLVTYRGPENNIPILVSVMAHLERPPGVDGR
jgi:hypothetical protein